MPYQSVPDPYCYSGTTVLRNIPNLRSQEGLDAFEARMTALRSEENIPAGRLSPTHYRAIHRHMFQDVYAWAGKYRTVRISKNASMFCYPEHIDRQMSDLFVKLKQNDYLEGLSTLQFATAAAAFLSTLNAIHPFCEGNGRIQLIFFGLLAHKAGHEIHSDRFDPETYLDASIAAFNGNEEPLASFILNLL